MAERPDVPTGQRARRACPLRRGLLARARGGLLRGDRAPERRAERVRHALRGPRAGEADAIQPGDDRPLAGVPIAIKDLGPFTEGIRTTFGTRLLGDFVPDHDSALVRRIRAAGAIIVGKTNTPEFGLAAGHRARTVRPRPQPWDTSHTTGGSSGGSAGARRLGHGAARARERRRRIDPHPRVVLRPGRPQAEPRPRVDGARLRRARRRNRDRRRRQPHGRRHRDRARHHLRLRDRRPLLGAGSTAPVRRGRRPCPRQAPDRLEHARRRTASPVHPDCEAAAREAADALESLGHEVTEAAPDWFDDSYVPNFLAIWAAGCSSQLMEIEASPRRARPEQVEPLTRELYEQGKRSRRPSWSSC